jgi:hypothetical protein
LKFSPILQLWTKLKSTIPCQRRFRGFEYLLNPQLLHRQKAETRIITLLCQFSAIDRFFRRGWKFTVPKTIAFSEAGIALVVPAQMTVI